MSSEYYRGFAQHPVTMNVILQWTTNTSLQFPAYQQDSDVRAVHQPLGYTAAKSERVGLNAERGTPILRSSQETEEHGSCGVVASLCTSQHLLI
jgi:hypothetical protein